jgi:8-oxo-dGTP pyrophosphatase MutT (NUDIX family)
MSDVDPSRAAPLPAPLAVPFPAPLAVPFPAPLPDLVERARAYRRAGTGPAPAVPSATVLMVRDSVDGGGLEVFMLRRVLAMAFAGGMHVFPGGVVDINDYIPDADIAAALLKAAAREAFEETGVLLASPAPAASLGPDAPPMPGADVLEADRCAVLAREATFDDVLTRHGLVLGADLLRPWSHWVTPEFEPRRYDTRFFIALMPGGQSARDVGGESDRVEWVRPLDAVAAHERAELVLMPPTEVTLREIAVFDTAADAFAAAEHRVLRPLLATVDLDVDPPRFVLTESSSVT